MPSPPLSFDPWDVSTADFPADAPIPLQAQFLLRYAILAPSSHNAQPWRFRVHDTGVDVYADDEDWPTVADHDGRELSISVGCAVENLAVAAARFGFAPAVRYPDDARAAHVDLTADEGVPVLEDADLFEAITERHTNHRPYADRPLPDGLRDRFRDCIGATAVDARFVTDDGTTADLGALQYRAEAHQFEDPDYRRELGRYVGSGALGDAWLMAHLGQLAVTYLDLGEREGRKNSTLLRDAPLVVVLTAPTDDDATRVEVGRVFERMALTASAHHLHVHPLSQILEVPELRAELRATLDLDGRPQHLFRVGYADEDEEHTPRRPLETVLL